MIKGENIMTMRESIEFLKRDRRVNSIFMDKLKSVGIDIEYGQYSYWDHQPYIQVGRSIVWIVEEKCEGNSTSLISRMQNDVVKELKIKIEKEVIAAKTADKEVENYFNSFS